MKRVGFGFLVSSGLLIQKGFSINGIDCVYDIWRICCVGAERALTSFTRSVHRNAHRHRQQLFSSGATAVPIAP